MTFKIVATTVTFGKINKEPLQRLLDEGYEVITNDFGRPFTEDELLQIAKDADALIIGNDKITANYIRQTTKLKIIAKHGVGVDGVDMVAAKEKNIIVTNAPKSNAEEVAELSIAMMLGISRQLYPSIRDLKKGIWPKYPGNSLYKKTIGIVGTGAIGCALARIANGFEMTILAYDSFKNNDIPELGGTYTDIDYLVEKSDLISLHLPLTPETKTIINSERINRMKKNVILVNTARAGLVDYTALDCALKDNKIKGYATDVFEKEPPEHLAMFEYDNVIITPHIGGTTKESNLKMGNMSVDNVIAVLSGKQPLNPLV